MTTETTDTHSPSPANTPLALKLTEGLGPAVPQEVMTYLHAYGDSRADDDGMSGARISEAIQALRRWSAAVQAAERKRWAEACDANAKSKRDWYAKTESDDDRGAAEMAEWLANCIRRA